MYRRVTTRLATAIALIIVFAALSLAAQDTTAKRARAVGTVKSISGNTVTLATDTGAEINVVIGPTTRLVRMEPGQSDLKSAPTISFSDIQVGDRLLAGGTASEDGRTVTAATAVVMKKSDVAEKQQHEREEWQKHGVGGEVKSVNAAGGVIAISTGALSTDTMAVRVTKETAFRRYPADSWNYDNAKPGALEQVKPGDQLNARGSRSADGKELSAVEVVTGTFRSIPGTVIASDAGNSTITVTDLVNKRPVTLKIGPDSQMHQLPAMFAQRIADATEGRPGAGPPDRLRNPARRGCAPKAELHPGARAVKAVLVEASAEARVPAGRRISSRCSTACRLSALPS